MVLQRLQQGRCSGLQLRICTPGRAVRAESVVSTTKARWTTTTPPVERTYCTGMSSDTTETYSVTAARLEGCYGVPQVHRWQHDRPGQLLAQVWRQGSPWSSLSACTCTALCCPPGVCEVVSLSASRAQQTKMH